MQLCNLPFLGDSARAADDPLAVAAARAEPLASLAGDEFHDLAAAVRAASA